MYLGWIGSASKFICTPQRVEVCVFSELIWDYSLNIVDVVFKHYQ